MGKEGGSGYPAVCMEACVTRKVKNIQNRYKKICRMHKGTPVFVHIFPAKNYKAFGKVKRRRKIFLMASWKK